jgi:hypothetical protein
MASWNGAIQVFVDISWLGDGVGVYRGVWQGINIALCFVVKIDGHNRKYKRLCIFVPSVVYQRIVNNIWKINKKVYNKAKCFFNNDCGSFCCGLYSEAYQRE